MREGLEEPGVLGELLQKYGQGGARGSTFRITMNVNQKEQKWGNGLTYWQARLFKSWCLDAGGKKSRQQSGL